jgi:spore germination cell wall hydrolase CwlJ-like protein|tara:strand:- start:266 stop:787 length:522 start_codon:yes stop_codon:yes gene_type:complete
MNNYPYQKLLFFIVLVITILYWGTAKSEVYEPKNHAFDCLAQNIYFEARSESQAGMIAVAQVTMNRVKHPRYPNTVCEVVKQGPTYTWAEHFPVRNKCQFSWFCDGKSDKIREPEIWKKAKMVAGVVLAMPDQVPNVVEDATHYHAYYVKPHWADHLEKITRIDSHIFYRVKE